MLFFTSDWHLGHKNILEHANRPFKDLDEMHSELVRRYRSVVSPKDEVWFLGDIGFWPFKDTADLISQLPGRKHLVYGNHDKRDRSKLAELFTTAQDYRELKYEDNTFILMHYPVQFWNKGHYGTVHLHGHCHGSLPFDGVRRRLDVGVDVHDFTPISATQVLELMKDCSKGPYHH